MLARQIIDRLIENDEKLFWWFPEICNLDEKFGPGRVLFSRVDLRDRKNEYICAFIYGEEHPFEHLEPDAAYYSDQLVLVAFLYKIDY